MRLVCSVELLCARPRAVGRLFMGFAKAVLP